MCLSCILSEHMLCVRADSGVQGWVGMRTVAQLRRELGVGAPRNPDSLYRPIERAPRVFNPLRIPKQLQVRTLLQLGPVTVVAMPMHGVPARRACPVLPAIKECLCTIPTHDQSNE